MRIFYGHYQLSTDYASYICFLNIAMFRQSVTCSKKLDWGAKAHELPESSACHLATVRYNRETLAKAPSPLFTIYTPLCTLVLMHTPLLPTPMRDLLFRLLPLDYRSAKSDITRTTSPSLDDTA